MTREQRRLRRRRERLEATLTVLRLKLPRALQLTLATTNPVDNLDGAIRRLTRNVKLWRDGPSLMIMRGAALGIAGGSRHFRRIKDHEDLPLLANALRAAGQIREAAQVSCLPLLCSKFNRARGNPPRRWTTDARSVDGFSSANGGLAQQRREPPAAES